MKRKEIIKKSQSLGVKGFPLGFWNYTNLTEDFVYMDEKEVESWADAGFTVTQSSYFDPEDPVQKAHILKMLDWAYDRGIKLVLNDCRCHAKMEADGSVPSNYRENVQKSLKDFGDHPGLFGFFIGDEPSVHQKNAFFECHKIQKELAPHLCPFTNHWLWYWDCEADHDTVSWPDYLDKFVEKTGADFISYDCYAQMTGDKRGYDRYFKNLKIYREASQRHGLPFWNTILSVGHYHYRCPNYNDIRWQFNTSVASGAQGIYWFHYYLRTGNNQNYRFAPMDEFWEKTGTYYDIRRVQRSFNRMYGDLFTRLASTRVTFKPEPMGWGDIFTANNVVTDIRPDKEGHPLLLGEFVDIDDRPYVMLVNNSVTDNVNATITFAGKNTAIFGFDWNGKEYKCGNADGQESLKVSNWLAPGQEVVYRVQKAF